MTDALSAINAAVEELRAEHRKADDVPGCVMCWPADGSWPCTSAMIADELAAAAGLVPGDPQPTSPPGFPTTVDELADNIADYAETATDFASWTTRFAIREAVRLTLEDARHHTDAVIAATSPPPAPVPQPQPAEPTTGWTRPRDEHGRAYYAPNETPPADERFAHWQGRLTHPEARCNRGDCVRAHEAPSTAAFRCYGGWIPSGDWWLHCSVCRPAPLADTQETQHG